MPKYGGETKFQLCEYPLSVSKAMSVEERKKRERLKVSDNNGQYIRLNQNMQELCHTNRLHAKIGCDTCIACAQVT